MYFELYKETGSADSLNLSKGSVDAVEHNIGEYTDLFIFEDAFILERKIFMYGEIVDINEASALILLSNEMLMTIDASTLHPQCKVGDIVTINTFNNNISSCNKLLDIF